MKSFILSLGVCLLSFGLNAQTLKPLTFSTNGTVNAMERDGDTLFIGGSFTRVGLSTENLSIMPVGADMPAVDGLAPSSRVYAAISDGSGGWYIAGQFTSINGQSTSRVAHILPNQSVDPAFSLAVNSTIQTLTLDGSDLYIGGSHTVQDGVNVNRITRVNAATGAIDASWLPAINNGGVEAIIVYGEEVYVGGSFSSVEGDNFSRHFVAFTKDTGELINGISVNSNVEDMHLDGDKLFVAGAFSEAGVYKSNIASFDPDDQSLDFAFPDANSTVRVIIPDGEGGWYIGGTFSFVGGESSPRIARIDANGAISEEFTLEANGTVQALYLDENHLYLAGSFSQLAGESIARLGRVNKNTGAVDITFNPNPNSTINALYGQGDTLFVGGSFSQIAGSDNIRNFAALSKTDGSFFEVHSLNSTVESIAGNGASTYSSGSFSSAGYYKPNMALLSPENDIPGLSFPDASSTMQVAVADGSGGWYIGGSFDQIEGQSASRIAHLLADGSLDTDFICTPNSTVSEIYLDGDFLYLGGSFSTINGTSAMRLARVNKNTGVLDETWLPNPNSAVNAILVDDTYAHVGGSFSAIAGSDQTSNYAAINKTTGAIAQRPSPNSNVQDIISSPDGDIFLSGSFSALGYRSPNLARFDAGTDIPVHLGISVNNTVHAVLPDGDGGYYLGGSFSIVDGISRQRIAHILADGTVDPDFSPTANSTVLSLALAGEYLYIGGFITNINGVSVQRLARVNATTGVLDEDFIPAINGSINALAVDGGNIYVGGSFSFVNTESRNRLAAFDADGELLAWNPDANSTVEVLYAHNGVMYCGGSFSQIGGVASQTIAALNLTTGGLTAFNAGAVNGSVTSILNDGTDILIGGSFSTIAGSTRSGVAKLNGTTGTLLAFSPAVGGGAVLSMAIDGDNLIIGGAFTTVNSETRNRMAELNKNTGALSTRDFDLSSIVHSIAIIDGDIFAGGSFTYAKERSRSRLAEIAASEYDIKPFDAGFINFSVNVMALDGEELFIGGSLITVSGSPRANFASINAMTGALNPLNPNVNSTVNTIAFTEERIYIGGSFTTVSAQSRPYAAAIERTTGMLSSWNPAPNSNVNTIAISNDDILMGGQFSYFDERNISSRIATFDAPSGTLANLVDGNTFGTVNVLALDGDFLYAGGSFSTFAGQSRQNFARFDMINNQLDDLALNVNATVLAIDFADNKMYLGGTFTSVNDESRGRAAQFNLDTETLEPWNPGFNSNVLAIDAGAERLLFAGSFGNVSNISFGRVARFDLDAKAFDADFTPNFNSTVHSLAIHEDELYAGGFFGNVNGQVRSRLAGVNKETGLLTDLSHTFNGTPWSLHVDADTLYAGGDFTTVSDLSRLRAVSFDLSTGTMNNWNPTFDNTVDVISGDGTNLIVGGNFNLSKFESRQYFAAINLVDSEVLNYSFTPNSTVNTIGFSDDQIFIGGSFNSVNNQSRNRVASFSRIDATLTDLNPNVSGTVNALRYHDGLLYIGGAFTSIGGTTRQHLGAVNVETGALSPFDPSPNSTIECLEVAGDQLYFGGSFSTVGGTSRGRLASANLATGALSDFNPGSNSTVNTISFSDGLLYAGGSFSIIGGESRQRLASLSPVDGSATAWNPELNGTVQDIFIDQNYLFAGGSFTTLDGESAPRLVLIDKNTAELLFDFAPAMSSTVNALHFANGSLNVGGAFTNIENNYAHRYLAEFTLPVPGTSTFEVSLSSNTEVNGFDIACFGESTGEVEISLSGGTGPYSYTLTNNTTNLVRNGIIVSSGDTSTESNLPAGNYTIVVTDSDEGIANGSITLTQPANFTANLTLSNPVQTEGGDEASLTVNLTGGTAPFDYVYTRDNANPVEGTIDEALPATVLEGLSAGVYNINLTDANGCAAQATRQVNDYVNMTLEFTVVSPVNCNGDVNGRLRVRPFNGVPPYSYVLDASDDQYDRTGIVNNSGFSSTENNLGPATYTVVVTDQTGATVTADAITLLDPPVLSASASVVTIATSGNSDGVIQLTILGGVANYNYFFTRNGTFAGSGNSPDGNVTRTGLQTGTYVFTVTDANGCQVVTESLFLDESIDPCASAGGDSDGDGICDDDDPCPLLADLENGDPCLIGATPGEVVDCICTALDCAGVPGGSAFLDDCDECVGGTTGLNPCVELSTIECPADQSPEPNAADCGYAHEGSAWDAVIDLNCSASQLISTFDTDAESWSVHSPSDPSASITYLETGGNPDGYIRFNEPGQGTTDWFSAPAAFLGDKEGFYGGEINFDLRISNTANLSSVDHVRIIGGGLSLAATIPLPNSTWQSFNVPLESGTWRLSGSATLATEAQIKTVLADLQTLNIAADWRSGSEQISLDNFEMVPGPTTYVLSGATTGTGTSLDGVIFNSGETTVTWTAADNCGTSLTCDFTVNVPGATAEITVGGDSGVCFDEVVQLTASAGDSYLWSTGATTQSIQVGAGTYSVTVTTAGTCSATSEEVEIVTYPVDDCGVCLPSGPADPEWNNCGPCGDPDIAVIPTWYLDNDGDGFGQDDETTTACEQPAGYAAVGGDCDDSDADINPDAQTLTFLGTGEFVSSIISPQVGAPTTTYNFAVVYTDATGALPPVGFPRALLDYENNGIFNNPNDRVVLLTPADVNDLNTVDGKVYLGSIVPLIPGSNYATRVQVQLGGCLTEIGPFDYPDVLTEPDLQIFANDISFDNFNPDVDSPLEVTANIQNVSDLPATNFTVRLVNQFDPDIVYPDITVPFIGANSSLTLTWDIITPDEPAWCPMEVIVDVNNVIVETNEGNNRAIRPFINGDFIVPGEIVITAGANPPSQFRSNSAQISVSGSAEYDDTAVLLLDPSVAGATVTITNPLSGSTYTGLTNSNGNFNVPIFLGNIPAGTYTYEGSITDFTLTGTFTVQFTIVEPPEPICLPDLRAFVNLAPTQIFPGETVDGTITVTNTGCAATTVASRLAVSQTGGLPVIEGLMVPPLAVGESYVLPFNDIQFDAVGTYSICGTADADNDVIESNENNNTGCDQVIVRPPLPDIATFGGNVQTRFICQDPVFSSVIATNIGFVPSGAFDYVIEVRLDGVLENTQTGSVSNLNPSQSTNIPVNYNLDQLGVYTVNARFDTPFPDGVVVEISEANNEGNYTINVNQCLPDLIVQKCGQFDVDPVDLPIPGDATYTARVRNQGNGPATGPVTLLFELSNGDSFEATYPDDIGVGEIVEFTATQPAVPSEDGVELTATVNPDGTITESNPNNNSYTNTLCWEFAAVRKCGFNFWDKTYAPNTIVNLNVGLRAEHLYKASSVDVKFEVSGPGIDGTADLGNATVNNVRENCGCPYVAVLPTTYFFNEPGVYTFTMTADPDNEYSECDEENNALVVEVLVSTLPDMRVLSQYINPTLLNPDIGENIFFDITYDNVGASNVADFMDLAVFINEVPFETVPNVPGLFQGTNNTLTLTMPWSGTEPGVNIVRAVIDSENAIAETNELNNEATRAIVVGDAANLFFEVFEPSDAVPNIGQPITIDAIIGNNGQLDVDADVVFSYLNASGVEVTIGTLPVSVEVGGSQAISLPWNVVLNNTTLLGEITNASEIEFNYNDNFAEAFIGAFDVSITEVPFCDGEADGSLTANASGGAEPYTFSWSNGFVGQTLTAEPGTYVVTVTDSDGNQANASGVIGSDPSCVPAICSMSAVSFAVSETCNPETGLYTASLTLAYENAPDEGFINVNGEAFPITGSPQSFEFTYAEGPVAFNAAFTENTECGLLLMTGITLQACEQDCADIYGGSSVPDECNVCRLPDDPDFNSTCLDCEGVLNGNATPGTTCTLGDQEGVYGENCNCIVEEVCGLFITSVEASETCNPETGLYTVTVELTYVNAPEGGDIVVNNTSFAVTSSPQTVMFNQAEGPVNISAYFENEESCAATFASDITLQACEQDCADIFGGSSVFDECEVCRLPDDPNFNTTCLDCAGVPNGNTTEGSTCSIDGVIGAYDESCECIPTPFCTLSVNGFEVSESCDPETGLYAISVEFSYNNAPTEGTLVVNGFNFPIGDSPQTVSFQQASGNLMIEAFFTEVPDCGAQLFTQVELEACEADCEGVFNGTSIPGTACVDVTTGEAGIWSLDCTCEVDEVPVIPGCTDPAATNFDPEANEDDGSCEYPQITCTDYRYYLADSPINSSSSDIYGVEISGGNANLTLLTTVAYQAHIGFNEATYELYIVNRNNGAFETYDLATGITSGPTVLSTSLSNVAQAVMSPAGYLIVGSETTNSLYTVDVITGSVSPLPGDVLTSVNGGDLVYGANGALYYASRDNGGQLIDPYTNAVVGNMPTRVTGVALAANGNIMTSSRNFDELREYGPTGSVNALAIYPTLLDGAPITVKPTDLASGCIDGLQTDDNCYGHEVLVYERGSGNVALARRDSSKALGEPERDDTINFVALGFGGKLIIGFEEAATAVEGQDDLEVVETSWGKANCQNYTERADVYVSQQVVDDADDIDETLFVYLGQSCTNGAFFDVHAATGGWEYFTMVKFVDASPVVGNRDGFDVDGIVAMHGCQPVPQLEIPEPGNCYATESVAYVQGSRKNGNALPGNRTNPNKALGEPERTDAMVFVTLGYEGSITLGFGGAVLNLDGYDLEVVETSFGNPGCNVYPEFADVYVSQDGIDFHLATTVCKSEPFVDISDAGDFDYIMYVKIVNNDDLTTTPDGYDLDGVVALHNCDEEEVQVLQLQLASRPSKVEEWDGTEANDPETMMGVEAFDLRSTLKALPNPTVGPSKATFTAAYDAQATLEVYDLSGRRIATLLNQMVVAGHQYQTDFDGSPLPNGVYLYRLTSEHEVIIEKFIVAK